MRRPNAAIERGAYSTIVYLDGDLTVADDNVGTVIMEETNAATVLQAALDSLSVGGKLFIDAGIYNVGVGVGSSTDGITVEGSNRGIRFLDTGSIIKATANAITVLDLTGSGAVSRNFGINGDNKTSINGLKQYRDSVAENIFIKNCTGYGLTYTGCDNRISGCLFSGCKTGIETGGSDGYILDCIFSNEGVNTMNYAVDVKHGSTKIMRAHVWGVEEACILIKGNYTQISNSYFDGYKKYGIKLDTAGGDLNYEKISGCIFTVKDQAAANTYDAIAEIGTGKGWDVKILNSEFIGWDATKARYCIYGEMPRVMIMGNTFHNGAYTTDAISITRYTPDDIYVKHNIGWREDNIVLSPSFAIDSTGVKIVTIPHGLAITPAKEDCTLTVVEDTNVDDWGFDLLKVDSVDATNVTAKIHVSKASATGSATAKLNLRVGQL